MSQYFTIFHNILPIEILYVCHYYVIQCMYMYVVCIGKLIGKCKRNQGIQGFLAPTIAHREGNGIICETFSEVKGQSDLDMRLLQAAWWKETDARRMMVWSQWQCRWRSKLFFVSYVDSSHTEKFCIICIVCFPRWKTLVIRTISERKPTPFITFPYVMSLNFSVH